MFSQDFSFSATCHALLPHDICIVYCILYAFIIIHLLLVYNKYLNIACYHLLLPVCSCKSGHDPPQRSLSLSVGVAWTLPRFPTPIQRKMTACLQRKQLLEGVSVVLSDKNMLFMLPIIFPLWKLKSSGHSS